MGFMKKITGMFGFGHHDGVNTREEAVSGDGDNNHHHHRREENHHQQPKFRETGLPRRGFGVPVQVAVERSNPGPVLQHCADKNGGIQGLRWYATGLRIDEDGDVADEFVEDDDCKNTQGRCKTKAAKVRGLVLASDGKLQPLLIH